METTFTLLDSVTYSRISRGLGGLIFPPSSKPAGEGDVGREREGWQEREKEKENDQSRLVHEIKYLLVATRQD